MGLLTALLAPALGPARALVWLAEQIAEQAEQQVDEGTALRRALVEADMARARGEIDDEELAERQNVVLARMLELRRGEP